MLVLEAVRILYCLAMRLILCWAIGDYNRGYSRFVRVHVSFIFFFFESLLDYGFRESTVPEILVNAAELGLFCIVGAAYIESLY